MNRHIIAAGFGLLVCAATPAGAQTTIPAPVGPPPTPGPRIPEHVAPPSDGVARGVVRPPMQVDPAIQVPAPTPEPNTTPVIPPPGTPGGNPTVQPR